MADETRSAGWYPDPDSAAGERWWNGAGWSDSRRGGAGAAQSTPYGPGSTSAVPLPPSAAATAPVVAPPVYSAENPAPQRPDPYAQSYQPTPVRAATAINVSANRNAIVGFVTGLIALFANVFYVLGPISIVFSALGLVKARQLAAQGVKANLMVFAVIGLFAGGISTVIGIISIIAFISSLFTANPSN